LFGRKNKIEVIETDNMGEKVYATKRTVIFALIPLAVTVPFVIKSLTKETYTATTIPVSTPSIVATIPPPVQIPSMPTSTTLEQLPPVAAEPVGVIADASLDMLANVLDPLIQIMVAISFPIASVIMVGACFFFMFGNNEKAWDMIMKAGLGYVLIQLSPLFLTILRQVGEAV
jgi:hypothetical protein